MKLLPVFFLTFVASSQAAQPIEVLVARGSGASSGLALSIVDELNDIAENSELLGMQFVNANTATSVESAPCSGTNTTLLLECAKTHLESIRRQHAADIVVMLVPTLGSATCGAVPLEMINVFFVGKGHRDKGYAVVSSECVIATGLYPASHEVGHLLSVEHKQDDPHDDRPNGIGSNHAATSGTYATAVAVTDDCTPNPCSQWENVLSEDGEFFSGGTQYPAGNSSHSDAKNFVSDLSWDVVASYFPVDPPQSCQLAYEFYFCVGGSANGSITASLDGYDVTNADYDVQLGGSGPWVDIFEGILTCPSVNLDIGALARAILQTEYGSTECTIWIPVQNCEDDTNHF